MRKILFLILLLSVAKIHAQDKKAELTGNLNIDSKLTFDKTYVVNDQQNLENFDHKKPILAALMSLAIPGTGEFYTENYLKSAAFVAVEAAAIVVGLIYDKKGDDQTTFFQNYADQHWSVNRYALWTVTNAKSVNDAIDISKYHVFDNNNNVNWSELNKLESDIGSYYSHHLPYYGEQQYFELIGKYPQFVMGWDDFGDENTKFEYHVERDNLTQNFYYYSKERGIANDYYNVAAKAVLVVVANHVISALDAAWSAHQYNKSFQVSTSLEKNQIGFRTYYQTQLNLQYSF